MNKIYVDSPIGTLTLIEVKTGQFRCSCLIPEKIGSTKFESLYFKWNNIDKFGTATMSNWQITDDDLNCLIHRGLLKAEMDLQLVPERFEPNSFFDNPIVRKITKFFI